MSHSRELFDGPPILKDRKLGTAISTTVLLWFIWLALLFWLFSCTLITVREAFRLVGWMVAASALFFLLVRRRLGVDGWGSFLFSFFGLVPAGLVLLLSLNRSIGPVSEEAHRITGLVRSSDSRTFTLVLEGDPFPGHPPILQDVEAEADLWYADSVRYSLRRGLLGHYVLLTRHIIFSWPQRTLPEVKTY